MLFLRVTLVLLLVLLVHVVESQEAYQREMLEQINDVRQRSGLRQLCLERRLIAAAEVHSKDMARGQFVGHTGSNGKSPFQRIQDQGYQYITAAENIGSVTNSDSVPAAMRTFIASSGHRHNLLQPNVRQLGVARAEGACRGGQGKCVYWTQVFASTRDRAARCL